MKTEVIVDATALDTGHRNRGIGRYVAGLAGELDSRAGVGFLRIAGVQTQANLPGNVSLTSPTFEIERPDTSHLLRLAINELKLSREIRRTGARVMHATEPWGLPTSGAFSTVATVHDLIPLVMRDHYSGYANLQWKLYYPYLALRRRWAHIDRVIAISEATRADVINHLGVPEDRIRVVYNGVDHDRFSPPDDAEVARVRARYSLDGPYVFYVGGYDYRKNVDVLVKSMAHVGDVRLALAGGMSDDERVLLDRVARESGVLDRVQYLGFVDDDDLPALYAGALCYGYPSLMEGFGLQVLEAMACGSPVVTSDCSSLAEVAGDAALLVDPTDDHMLGQAISSIRDDDDVRQDMVRRGLARSAEFSWERCARETWAVYQELL